MRWFLTAAAVLVVGGIAQLGDRALVALTFGVALIALAVTSVRVAQAAPHHPRDWRSGWFGIVIGTTLMVLTTVASVAEVTSVTPALLVTGSVLCAGGLIRLLQLRLPRPAVLDIVVETVLLLVALGLVLVSITGAAPTTYVAVLRDGAVIWLSLRLSGLSDERPRVLDYTVAALVVLFLADAAMVLGALDPSITITNQLVIVPLWALILLTAGSLHPSLESRFADVSPARSTEVRGSHLAIVLGVVVLGPAAVLTDHMLHGGLGAWWFVASGLGLPLVAATHLVRQVHLRVQREYRANHDALTGLANRQLLGDRLSNELARARRGRDRVAVMMLDLDRFKTINDSLGHDVGDGLLVAIAKRLEASVREVDTVARLGGDEFAIVMPGVDSDQDALTVARKVRDVFVDPFPVGGRQLFVGTSIGIALGPDDASDAKQLLKRADTAMYRAKAEGGGGIQFFTAEMSDRARVRLSLEGSLRSAIASGQFELAYQPQIDVDTRRIVAVEALARWQHPQLGTITPGAFIPLAEETGAIIELGEWVLQTACEQVAHWHDLGLLSVPVAVNVSGAQVVREPLHELVERVLARTGLPGHLLEIELTETALLRDMPGITASLERLHDQGVRCAIDDFGSGYGGLTYLTQIPIDVLKIDRSFVMELEHDPRSAVVVEAVLAMAKSLGVEIVAEGVETPEQAAWLRARGCQRMQGFRYALPIPRREMTRALVHASVGRPSGWEVTVSSLLAADPDVAPIPALPGMAQERINAVLAETARGHRGRSTDPASLEAVLGLLFPDDQRNRTSRALDGVPVRLAVGTFAGLLPLTTGLATVEDLRDDARAVVSSVFDSVGVSRPDPTATVELAHTDSWLAALGDAHGPLRTSEPDDRVAEGATGGSPPDGDRDDVPDAPQEHQEHQEHQEPSEEEQESADTDPEDDRASEATEGSDTTEPVTDEPREERSPSPDPTPSPSEPGASPAEEPKERPAPPAEERTEHPVEATEDEPTRGRPGSGPEGTGRDKGNTPAEPVEKGSRGR